MSASAPLRDLYERMFQVIKAAPTIVPALVPEVNVHPEDDPRAPIEGAQIVYSWASARWSRMRKRGLGTFTLKVLSVENKLKAHDIIELLRDLLVPRNLSGEVDSGARNITVHLFKENEVATDTTQDGSGRWEIETSFEVRLVGRVLI